MSTLTHHHPPDLLFPLRRWLNNVQIHTPHLAHLICRLIPPACPFERQITLFGYSFHIPAFCKLNPLYNELVALRLRALTYLSDKCGEDITSYLC